MSLLVGSQARTRLRRYGRMARRPPFQGPLAVRYFGAPPDASSEDVERWRYIRRLIIRGQLPIALFICVYIVATIKSGWIFVPVIVLSEIGLVAYLTRRVRIAKRARTTSMWASGR